ncbi:hypothetical protein ILYODFUR_031088 [Ilyodon furcidens]|uniref:Uncharacterized protein n=1 Tax=Ilyodon furcidens TaxID=33524 RepID=A0ABV0UXQ0_9TELE
MNSLPTAQGHTPTGELHPRKADEATPTQHKLHTQPHSKHRCCIPPPPHREPRQQGKSPAQRYPSNPTTEPPTSHQDETNSTGKRSPASGKHSGPASPTTPPQSHKHTPTSLPLQR